MTIKNRIKANIVKGFTVVQARSIVAQQIILSKIEKSKYAGKILIKGGVVMYNITHEQRRTTLDLDFDFVHVDINDSKSIQSFISSLNEVDQQYRIVLDGKIEKLKQQHYNGIRLHLLINDSTESIKFKIDIGIHTLLDIEQNQMLFQLHDEKKALLNVNPPEQIIAEKLFSLAKIGMISTRFKDIDDIYFLIKNNKVDHKKTRDGLNLLVSDNPYGIGSMQDVVNEVCDCLNEPFFINSYQSSSGTWLNANYDSIRLTIIDFLNKL